MARYYEETALIEFVKQYTPSINGETTLECVVRAIREAPTADAVPKSNEYKMFSSKEAYEAYRIKVLKQDVAREIVAIAEQRMTLNSERLHGIHSDLWTGVYQGRIDAYQDIKEIIEQKYLKNT